MDLEQVRVLEDELKQIMLKQKAKFLMFLYCASLKRLCVLTQSARILCDRKSSDIGRINSSYILILQLDHGG